MSMSTFQKVTLASCVVLCVALLLPKMLLSRGKKDAERPEGHFPPMTPRKGSADGKAQRPTGAAQFSRAHNTEAIARAKGASAGPGTGGKSNLAGQIIPIYGFGILLYILYILFKITSKGSSTPTESRFPPIKSENTKRKITDFELAQLQERLRETEQVMENLVSEVNLGPHRVKRVSADQEESLLLQLREITRAMQEGHLVAPQETDRQHHCKDDPKDYGQSCPYHHDHAGHSSPPSEHEAERREPGDEPEESNLSMDVEAKAEADHPDTLNTEDGRQELLPAAAEATADVFKPQGREGGKDPDDHQDPDAPHDPVVPEDPDVPQDPDIPHDPEVLQDPEVPELECPADTPTAGSVHVRRRTRRRKGKKDSH